MVRSMGGEEDSVPVVTFPTPPISMTTTTTVNNNTNTIVLPPLQLQNNNTNNLLDVGSDDSDDDNDDDNGVGMGVGVGVGDMEDMGGLEGTLQPSSLHQLFQNSYVGKTAPMCTTTTHPFASALCLLIVTSNTLVPPSHYPIKTSGSGRSSNTGSKLVPVQSLPNNNDTVTFTDTTDPSIDRGIVEG